MVIIKKRKHYYLYIKSRGLGGIYIHIPYCKQACHYCNFHFSTTLHSIDSMVEAILKEIQLQKDYLNEEVETIYFGGGTPSILSSSQIERIINQVIRLNKVTHDPEITLEANPDDISEEKVSDWVSAGVNRISLGVQSFDDQVLNFLNRSHRSAEAVTSIDIINGRGIKNMTIDLMYGLPGQSLHSWETNLRKTLDFNVPHISAYALTIEEQTVLGHKLRKGTLDYHTDERYEEEYNLMCQILGEATYEHYEVSNFAQEGFKSRHNQAYWQGHNYLGIGPGAHSFDGVRRFFNISNNAKYIRSLEQNAIPSEKETLTIEQTYNEYILTGLRTNKGVDLKRIKELFETDLLKTKMAYLSQCSDSGLAYFDESNFVLTEKGFFVSDGIILELMK